MAKTSLKAKFESNRAIRGNYKGVSIQPMACLVLVDFTRPIARVREKKGLQNHLKSIHLAMEVVKAIRAIRRKPHILYQVGTKDILREYQEMALPHSGRPQVYKGFKSFERLCFEMRTLWDNLVTRGHFGKYFSFIQPFRHPLTTVL